MLFLSFSGEKTKSPPESVDTRLECELEEILSSMSGVGKAEVLINYSKSAEKQVAKNTKNDGERHEEEVVSIASSPVILSESLPKIQGIIVVCTGGGSSAVRTNVIRAVSALTGLTSKNIGVFKGV